MSLILDALKKLDREKAAKRRGTVEITSGILLQEGSRRRRIIVPATAVLFTAVAAVAATYYWAGMPSVMPVAVKTVPTVPAPVVPVTPSPQPFPPAAKQEPVAESKPAPTEPEKQQIASPRPPAAEASKPVERSRARTPATMEPARAQEKSADVSPADKSKFKVSGIVWQEERPARRAFVNDVPVREGDTVQGARVVEIHTDRVRFSKDGKFFDIRLFE